MREGVDECGLPKFRMGDYTLRAQVSKAGRRWVLAHAPRTGSAAPKECYVSCVATASVPLRLPPTVDQQLLLDQSVCEGEGDDESGAAAATAAEQQTWELSSEQTEVDSLPSVRA